jgi:Family of unknown function (DUF5990)
VQPELILRIVLEKPPAGVDFGLQDRRGSDYQTIQKHRSKGEDLRFQFGIRIKENGAGDVPKLVGSVVQGPAGARFVYLDIGTYASQTETCWNRRLKVPLSGITWDMIDRLADDSLTVLATRVPGTGRDGGPNCGTVKPFGGWKVVLAAN